MSTFIDGQIQDVIVKELTKFQDKRGWLSELYRFDEIPAEFHPCMAYISLTNPGHNRGPHEHYDQADYFCFLGPANFKLYLWDNRPDSPTYRFKQTFIFGIDHPAAVIIPKGVVHAYKNIADEPGVVFNAANRLYKGENRREPVDEIRHEEDKDTIFVLD